MLMALGGRIRRFAAASRGAVTVEFVVKLPVLITVLVFVSQHERAIQVRNALDVATRDATGFLSRAPLNQMGHADICEQHRAIGAEPDRWACG